MMEQFRPSFGWCVVGAVCGLAVAVAWGIHRELDPALLLLGGLTGGVVGCACGFMGATFYYGIRERGLGRVLSGALRYAITGLIFSPLLYGLGWSTQPTLFREMFVGASVLSLIGAYFEAAEVWTGKKEEGLSA